MGKNLKGKNCGKGICQRKDGLYYARFVNKAGKRYERYFQTLPEARNWIEDSKYADKHEDVFIATDTTVDQWFNFWIENIVGDLAPKKIIGGSNAKKHPLGCKVTTIEVQSIPLKTA